MTLRPGHAEDELTVDLPTPSDDEDKETELSASQILQFETENLLPHRCGDEYTQAQDLREGHDTQVGLAVAARELLPYVDCVQCGVDGRTCRCMIWRLGGPRA